VKQTVGERDGEREVYTEHSRREKRKNGKVKSKRIREKFKKKEKERFTVKKNKIEKHKGKKNCSL
jgi:hypothetical protein